MNYPYVSSSSCGAVRPRPRGVERLIVRLLQAWAGWQALRAAVAAELREQRLARDIAAAYADLDRHTREDLGVDRRRC